jgi:F420H(2)-dependent quinone reductase
MAIAEDLDHATDSQWDWVAEHTRTYLASGGTEGHESNGVHTLVLATTGRRTGTPRRTCQIYGTSGEFGSSARPGPSGWRRWWPSAAPTAPVPPMAGTAAIGAVVHLLATAIEEGRDLSSMSGILADTAYRLLLA